MNLEVTLLFALMAGVLVMLIWGRWRYDIVAFAALVIGVIAGLVPSDEAFSGFGHPATIVIALVLVLSRALSNAGVVDLVVYYLVDKSRRLGGHIAVMASLSASLSTLMNNVAALALLMPVDMEAARKAKRTAARTLMPMSFASILGGMVTLIGTPPNIVIAEYRADALGEPYQMFDFTPVGLACAVVGVAFVVLAGWRLLPEGELKPQEEDGVLTGYIAELEVPEDSEVIGKRVRELDEVAENNDAAVIGLVRQGKRMPGFARIVEIRKGDVLVVEANPEGIDKLADKLGLELSGQPKTEDDETPEDLALLEVAVPVGARIAGRSANSLRLLYRHGVALMGVARQGRRFRDRVRKVDIEPGDVLLLMGPAEQLPTVAQWMGCLPLAEKDLPSLQRRKSGIAVSIFAAAIVLASTGVLDLTVALAAAVVGMVATGIMPLRQLYDSIEWPVIVLLGSLIPLGEALETTGGTGLIADTVVQHSDVLSPVMILVLLMVVTMTLSDVLNNVATAVIAAPVAVEIAHRLGVNPDTYLMAVAVGASCAFLTPIGHKNNTLILGPGGYRFGDYWRMGLPLEVLIVLVATPMLLWVWPL
ncbi:SLC13 family permease [Lentisalinibacter salinarum]|uniref:SLC13 family permease n=1 Tax=Lentisalinibacter salinarum TaxID=2992239 RepID=UPI003869B92E